MTEVACGQAGKCKVDSGAGAGGVGSRGLVNIALEVALSSRQQQLGGRAGLRETKQSLAGTRLCFSSGSLA